MLLVFQRNFVFWSNFRRSGYPAFEPNRLQCDLSSEDDYYRHLVLWSTEDLEIVGAYRFADSGAESAIGTI